MTLSGNVLGTFQLQGTFHDVEMSLNSRTVTKLPGPSNEQRPSGKIEFNAPIPDLVVCATSEVDAVMGPIPSISRNRTGNTQFDSAYAVFVAPGAESIVATFRTSPAGEVLAWAKPEVLNQCIDLKLLWFRAQGGRCELVRPPMGPGAAHATLTLCANLARSAGGRALVEMPAETPVEPSLVELVPLWIVVLTACVPGAIFGGMFSAIPWLQSVNDESFAAYALHVTTCIAAACALFIASWVMMSLMERWRRQPS